MNRELLATSIFASAGLAIIYFLAPSIFTGLGILFIMSVVISYIASFTRYLAPIGFAIPIIAILLTNANTLSILLGIGLGIVSLAIPWIWELIVVLVYVSFSFLNLNLLPIPSIVFLYAIFSSLGFANLRASLGYGYPAIVKVKGLPKGVWYAEVNGAFQKLDSDTVKGEKQVELRLCPQYINGVYYIPSEITVRAKNGDKKIVNFSSSSTPPLSAKFPHCYAYFQVRGLPSNLSWSVKVNGYSFSARDPSQMIEVPMFNLLDAMWSVEEINLGNVVFKPTVNSGVVRRGSTVIIEYTSYVTQQVIQQQQTKPLLPSLDKWDPNIWVGRDLYGYKIVQVIASGGNGYVLKAVKDNSVYAIKVFSFSTPSNSQVTNTVLSTFDELFKESETLKNLSQNPKFVKIYGFYIDSNNIKSILKGNTEVYYNYPPLIVMEYMEGGTALDLATQSGLAYSAEWAKIVKEIVKEVAYALHHLHSNNFVHLDVKPENIFISRKIGNSPADALREIVGNIKLGDLGSAVRKGDRFYQATPSYSPPEQIEAIILGKGADPKMDIFALGMTAYVLLTLRKDSPISDYLRMATDAYISGNPGEAFKYISSAKQALASWRPSLPSDIPNDLKEVILRSLSVDPNNRPTALEIANMLR